MTSQEATDFIKSPLTEENMWFATSRSDPADIHGERDFVQAGSESPGLKTGFSHVDEHKGAPWEYPNHWEREDSWNYIAFFVTNPQSIEERGGIEQLVDDKLEGIEERAEAAEEE